MFELKFTTDNAAFDNGRNVEVAQILRDVAASIEARRNLDCGGTIVDLNGNRIGEWSLS